MPKKVQVLHSDDHLLVVNKESGVLSIPDRFVPEKFNLQTYLSETFGRTWVVHRLDRETSGVICFARTESAHRQLSQQFAERTVQKIYLALVDGRLLHPEGSIEKAIAPHPTQAGKMIAGAKGKPSLTHYRVQELFKAFTLVEAEIHTGRTHQVRVHFAAIGHPLAVDPLYGKREGFFLSEVKGRSYHLGKNQEERPLMSRTTLHAWQLTLTHPHTNQRMTFEAAPPKDFAAVLKQLRKWGKE